MITTLAIVLAVAAGQAADPATHEAPPKPASSAAGAQKAAEPREGRGTVALGAAEALLPEKLQFVKEGAPALAWGVPSRCIARGDVFYRAQCDEADRRCLVAPDAELDPEGLPVANLERAPACQGPSLSLADLTTRGYTVVPALAEAPPGWYRDERQRVMQVDFDLNVRFFLGGGWATTSEGPFGSDAVVSAGGRVDRPFTWWDAPALARMRILEGWASADGNHGELLVFGIDASRVYPTPILRITTFLGKPRRFDPPLNFGLWAEGLRMEVLETLTGETYDRTMMAAGAVTMDLWRSKDLSDFVRVRAGIGYEQSLGGDWASAVPAGAVESELTLGSGGFHHVRASAVGEILANSGDSLAPALPANRSRVTLKAEYEVILFALNNQPVSLAVEAKAVKRDDVPDYPTDWIVHGGAQLRFSLWAPPRRDATLQTGL